MRATTAKLIGRFLPNPRWKEFNHVHLIHSIKRPFPTG